MEIIKVRELGKKFGEHTAVDSVSFDVMNGEIFGLLGPNGAGKSTLISMLTTLLAPDKGEVFVNEQSLKQRPAEVKKLLGLVPQEIALYPTLTARENLMFWGRMYGLGGSLLKDRVDEALDIAGLKDRAKGRIDTFSGGMKRRINIASALLHRPRILVMDEPTVGIDPQSRNHILETVLRLNKEGMTVVYTSHYMEEVELLCSRVAIMDHGRIIAMGTKDELRKLIGDKDTIYIQAVNPSPQISARLKELPGVAGVSLEGSLFKIIADDGDTVLAGIISILDAQRCKIHSVSIEESNLEGVFLHLTGRALRD